MISVLRSLVNATVFLHERPRQTTARGRQVASSSRRMSRTKPPYTLTAVPERIYILHQDDGRVQRTRRRPAVPAPQAPPRSRSRTRPAGRADVALDSAGRLDPARSAGARSSRPWHPRAGLRRSSAPAEAPAAAGRRGTSGERPPGAAAPQASGLGAELAAARAPQGRGRRRCPRARRGHGRTPGRRNPAEQVERRRRRSPANAGQRQRATRGPAPASARRPAVVAREGVGAPPADLLRGVRGRHLQVRRRAAGRARLEHCLARRHAAARLVSLAGDVDESVVTPNRIVAS